MTGMDHRNLVKRYYRANDIWNKKRRLLPIFVRGLTPLIAATFFASFTGKSNKAAGPRDRTNEVKDTTGGKRGNLTRNVGRSLADWLALPLRLLCDSEWGMLRWVVVVCRGWWRWVDSSVGWLGWLCVLRSCCARETRGFQASRICAARRSSDQFHVARTSLSSTTFTLRLVVNVAPEVFMKSRREF